MEIQSIFYGFYIKCLDLHENSIFWKWFFCPKEQNHLFYPFWSTRKYRKQFNIFGGDEKDLQRLNIVTPNEQIFFWKIRIHSREVYCRYINTYFEWNLWNFGDKRDRRIFINLHIVVLFDICLIQKSTISIPDNGTWGNKFLMIRSIYDQHYDIGRTLKNDNWAEELKIFLAPEPTMS